MGYSTTSRFFLLYPLYASPSIRLHPRISFRVSRCEVTRVVNQRLALFLEKHVLDMHPPPDLELELEQR